MIDSTPNSIPDPITQEVVRNKPEGIANEMQSTLLRSSFSPIVKEGLDASACLFTLEGETLTQAIADHEFIGTPRPVGQGTVGVVFRVTNAAGEVVALKIPNYGRWPAEAWPAPP